MVQVAAWLLAGTPLTFTVITVKHQNDLSCVGDVTRRCTDLRRSTSAHPHYSGGKEDITGAPFEINLQRDDRAAAEDDGVGEESVFYRITLRRSSPSRRGWRLR